MKCVGIICSLTILFVLLTTLVMTPVLISFGRDRKPKPGVDGEGGTRMSRWMEMLNDFTFRHSKPIVAIFTVVCVGLAIGLWKIEPAFDIERTMGINVPYVKDVLTVGHSELGALYSYDQLMIPVIDNIPMLIVVLLLTIPVAILAMRLAEKKI